MEKQSFWIKFKNPGTIVSLASLVILILTTNGFNVDNEKVMTTIKALCSIAIYLGAMNNPDTPGLDLPELKK